MRKGIFIVNLGTPDAPTVDGLRKYHHQFFSDPAIIDGSWLTRQFVKYCIILPFRSPKMAKLYQEIWTEKGGPLLVHGLAVQEKLQQTLGTDYVVELGMNYGSPSIKDGLTKLQEAGVSEVKIIPLFPQNAAATTGSIQYFTDIAMKEMDYKIPVSFETEFYDHPQFIEAWKRNSDAFDLQSYDHVVFSYHGVPERQLKNVYETCCSANCCDTIGEANKDCYKAQCHATTRLISEKINLPEDKYTIAFQSRLGKEPWAQPYLDDVLQQLQAAGKKNVLIYSPSFIADCLETTHELGIEYNEEFRAMGGEKLTLVPSLNDSDTWVSALKDIAQK